VWDGVDKVRRQEHRQLVSEGDRTLTGTTYRWLQNPERMSSASAAALDRLKNMTLKTSRAWALRATTDFILFRTLPPVWFDAVDAS
jgi:transposase